MLKTAPLYISAVMLRRPACYFMVAMDTDISVATLLVSESGSVSQHAYGADTLLVMVLVHDSALLMVYGTNGSGGGG